MDDTSQQQFKIQVMKKYLIIIVTLIIGLSTPSLATAQEKSAEVTTVDAYVQQWSANNDSITIIEVATDKAVTLDADTYNDNVKKGYPINKIFKNQLIDDSDESGMGVTLMSMCIVLLALIVLSLLFLFFGKLFAKNQSKKKNEAKGETIVTNDDDHDSGEVIAAIAMALNEHFNSKHDLEDTVLTIRRMKRAYSPWNSKIYNMREVPEVRRNR